MSAAPPQKKCPFIVGANFGRTGTVSLKLALEKLTGAPVYHMKNVMQGGDEHDQFWIAAARGQVSAGEMRAFLAPYAGAVDWPASAFVKLQLEAFPDAVVIISERDDAGWYKSVYNTVYEPVRVKWMWLLRKMLPSRRLHQSMMAAVVWDGVFGGRFDDAEHAKAVFREYKRSMASIVPPERLIVHTAKDGWGPLCKLLKVPVPDEPYPHANTGEETRAIVGGSMNKDAMYVARCAALLVGVAAVVWAGVRSK